MNKSMLKAITALSFLSLSATSVSFADVCQINSKAETVQNALEVLQKNYSGANEVTLVWAPLKRGASSFAPFATKYRDLKIGNEVGDINGNGPYFLWATLSDSGVRVWIDLGFTYYLDQTTGKYTNLGLTVNCDMPKRVEVNPTIDFPSGN